MQFLVAGSSVLLDDVSLVQTNTDPANTTAFRDPVLAALRTFDPGVLRANNTEHAETLDNLIAPPFGRSRNQFTAYGTNISTMQYGLHEFLELAETLQAEPYVIIPLTFSDTDVANLIEYLGGSATTPYGARRTARGHPAPWMDAFQRIHLEFGNEAWNPVFQGATMDPTGYGQRGSDVFGIIKASPYYSAKFNLILGVQSAGVFNSRLTHNASANHDAIAIGPYMAGLVNDFESNERLFGGLFAEASWWSRPSHGFVWQTYDMLNTSSRPVPLVVYEVNLHTTQGAITQAALDSFLPSVGAGLGVGNHMMHMLREARIREQVLFSLGGYLFTRDDGKTMLWAAVVRDLGVTDRKRPQFLAVQLLNEALAGDLVQTTHSGDNPMWNQPLTNRIALDNVPFIQSFALVQGAQRSLVVFNLHRDSPLEVTFTGSAPSGNVTLSRLTSAAITNNNENAENVQITRQQLTNFDPAQPLSLPPFSLNVLSWNATARGDINADGVVNVVDVIYLIFYFFAGGPVPLGLADVNADGVVDIRDLFALINYLFAGGSIPSGFPSPQRGEG